MLRVVLVLEQMKLLLMPAVEVEDVAIQSGEGESENERGGDKTCVCRCVMAKRWLECKCGRQGSLALNLGKTGTAWKVKS